MRSIPALALISVFTLSGPAEPSSAEDAPSITHAPPRTGASSESAGREPVPCDVLIRYDDGSDDFPNIGRTLGGTNNETQGILATPPGTAEVWFVQSAGFFADFWVTPGVVNVVIQGGGVPAPTTSEPIFVDGPGDWEVAFPNPVCVVGDFEVVLCAEPGTHGVTGEDVESVDVRSFHQIQTCANTTPIHNLDLMIWACVTPCQAVPTHGRSWGSVKSRYR